MSSFIFGMKVELISCRLPDSCTFEQASLAEPLSVIIHASRRCGLAPSQSVLVYGVGAIGLLACAFARHTGASRVCAIDINPARLEFAMKHGFADAVYCLPPPSSPSLRTPLAPTSKPNSMSTNGNGASKLSAPATAPVTPTSFSEDQIRRAKDSATAVLTAFDARDGFDIVFECTGAETAIQMSVFVSIFPFLSFDAHLPSIKHSLTYANSQQ